MREPPLAAKGLPQDSFNVLIPECHAVLESFNPIPNPIPPETDVQSATRVVSIPFSSASGGVRHDRRKHYDVAKATV